MTRAKDGGAVDMIQARGGIEAGSPPQRICDACGGALDPAEAVEVTLTKPPPRVPGRLVTRLYGHPGCKDRLGERVLEHLGYA